MAHISGNATWSDYPSTATLITAARLEAIEGAIDTLYNPPSFSARTAASFTATSGAFTAIPLTTTLLDSHTWKSGNTYVPQRAGYYLCVAAFAQSTIPGGTGIACMPQLNAAPIDAVLGDLPFLGGVNFLGLRVQGVQMVFCNGSTDAVRGAVYQNNASTQTFDSGSLQCWWFRP